MVTARHADTDARQYVGPLGRLIRYRRQNQRLISGKHHTYNRVFGIADLVLKAWCAHARWQQARKEVLERYTVWPPNATESVPM